MDIGGVVRFRCVWVVGGGFEGRGVWCLGGMRCGFFQGVLCVEFIGCFRVVF